MLKRGLSLLLALMMMLTLVTPVYAEAIEGQTTIRLKIRPQQGEWKYIEKAYSGRDNSTYYAVELYAETDEETFKLSGAQFYLNFDKDVLEFRTLKSTDDDSIKYDEEDSENALNVTQPTPSECNSKGYVPLILSCNTNHVLKSGITLVTAVFTVKQNAESGIANFTLAAPENAEKETMCSFNVTENGKPVVTSHTVDDSATATVTINGVAPTLGKVTVTDKDKNTVLDTSDSSKTFDTLEVNGTTDYTYQAHAWSTSGKEITGNVTWKFKVGSELCTEFRGATIDETTGQIFIPKDASTDVSGTTFAMSVVAQAKEGVTAEKDIETSLIQVRREEYRIAAIQISRKDGETGALIIPGKDEAPATAEFVATCTNQYDKPYKGNQTVYWDYERVGSQYGVKTVAFTNQTTTGATLKAEAGAADSVTDSATLKVKAYAGDINNRVYSNEVEITVQRDTVQRPAKIVISGGPANSTLPVLKTGDPTATATATYTATVYDQYGTEIENPGEIRWYLEAGDESQRFGTGNESKFIAMKEFAQTFAEGSTSREITIKAICGDASSTTTLTLTREKARATRIAMEDITIAVPKSGEAEVTRSYLEVYDQYDIKMGSPTFEKTTTPNTLNGVTFTDDKITVTSAAAGNTFINGECQFTLTITCNSASTDIVSATKTITLKRELPKATAIGYSDGGSNNRKAVPYEAGVKVPASVEITVYDQYGQIMNGAEVQSNGALPTGIILENGKLYITKDAVDHFNGVRGDSTKGIRVSLKSGNAQVTVTVHLKLADAQTNPQSATISGQTSIARPTDDTPNTAVYTILKNEIKDQYGLPLTFDPAKLTMMLADEGSSGIADSDHVGISKVNGKWTITVKKGAALRTYDLMAQYQAGVYAATQCAPVMKITITEKETKNTLTVTQGDITYGETVNPSVSNKPAGAGDITYTYEGRDGTTYNSSDAPTNAGKYTVTATCEDATCIYTGSVDFQILPKKIEVGWIELDGTRYTYNGQQQTVKYTVKDGNTTLVKDRDYTVEGDKQTNAGVHLLKIIGKGNYTSDPTGAPSVNWNIWEATLTVTGADIPAINYDPSFNGELNVNSVTFNGLVNNETLAKGTDYTVAATVGNRNAGTHQVVLTVRLLNENYKFEQGSGIVISDNENITVTINKIDHRAEAVSAEGKYGSTVRVPLAEYLPDGWSVQQSAISVDSNGVVHKSFRLEDTTLVVELNNSEALVGKYVKITLPVASTNYNDFTITVTVTVRDKATQTVTAKDLNVTYGDAGVKLNASALDNAKLTYQVTEGADVVAVDANGNVTLLKSGTAKIQITAAETEDYGVGTKLVTVTVAKRSLTVKANDLTAYVGGQLPALDYTVTGLTSGDMLTVLPELELKDVPAGVDPMKTAGTYTIGFKTAPVADPDKYDLTVETGTLTVSSRPNVNPVPAGNSVKLEEAAGGKLTSSVSRATKGTTVTITVKPDAGYQLEELEVLDKNGEALPLKELANGKFSFQMPDSKVTVQASFVQESTYAGYPDVLPQDWFYSSVRYVTERGLMKGTPNGFEPNMDSSRATIWTILARFSGVDTTVVSGEWYAVARQWAMENGVSDGTNPNGVITREQLATMLYRFAKNKGLVQEPVTADLSVFVDAGQISGYALDAMRWAVSVGLLNGMDGNRLAPQGSAARAQVAAMLMRFDQLAK